MLDRSEIKIFLLYWDVWMSFFQILYGFSILTPTPLLWNCSGHVCKDVCTCSIITFVLRIIMPFFPLKYLASIRLYSEIIEIRFVSPMLKISSRFYHDHFPFFALSFLEIHVFPSNYKYCHILLEFQLLLF